MPPNSNQRRNRQAILAGILFCLLLVSDLCMLSAAHGLTPYGGWTVESIEITGIPKQLAATIGDGLALNVRSGFLGLKKPHFREKHLLEDVERIRYFLARHGYPAAVIEPRLEAIDN